VVGRHQAAHRVLGVAQQLQRDAALGLRKVLHELGHEVGRQVLQQGRAVVGRHLVEDVGNFVLGEVVEKVALNLQVQPLPAAYARGAGSPPIARHRPERRNRPAAAAGPPHRGIWYRGGGGGRCPPPPGYQLRLARRGPAAQRPRPASGPAVGDSLTTTKKKNPKLSIAGRKAVISKEEEKKAKEEEKAAQRKPNKKKKIFLGQRIKRGYFKTGTGKNQLLRRGQHHDKGGGALRKWQAGRRLREVHRRWQARVDRPLRKRPPGRGVDQLLGLQRLPPLRAAIRRKWLRARSG
nr:hypothetical protein [Tanacetum cinerariifolium]